MTPDDDEALRGVFESLRAEDARSTPGFEGLLRRAEAHRPQTAHPLRWAAVAAAAAAFAAVLLRPGAPDAPPPSAHFQAGSLRVPSDVLLRVPGSDLLGEAPRSLLSVPVPAATRERSERPPRRTLT